MGDPATPARGGAAAPVARLPVPVVGNPAPEPGLGCLAMVTAPSTATPMIAREAAEERVRDGYALPLRLGRPCNLLDAQAVTVVSSTTGGPANDQFRGMLVWHLVFDWLAPPDQPTRPDSVGFLSAGTVKLTDRVGDAGYAILRA